MTNNPSTMKTEKHWKVITRDGWPAIQSKGQDSPFIVWANNTPFGPKAARRWAEIVCDWMNEQMRLSNTSNKPRNCDAMLSLTLKQTQGKLLLAETENKHLKENLTRSNSGVRAALRALNQIT